MTFTEKSKRKQAPARPMQRFLLAGFVFLCAAMIGFMLLTANNDYVTCFDTPFPALDGVEHQAFFTLPTSAQNVEYAAKEVGNGCTIWVSFEIDPGDVKSFQASSRVTSLEPNRKLHPGVVYMMQQHGWTPPTTFLYGFNALDMLTSQYMLVDLADTSRLKVYLIVRKDRTWPGT